MHVRLNKKVYLDLESAMAYYSSEAGNRIATEFYEEFRRCRSIIAKRPLAYPEVRDGVRRINLHKFPYHILYQIEQTSLIHILVLKHDRRDPDFGLDR